MTFCHIKLTIGGPVEQASPFPMPWKNRDPPGKGFSGKITGKE
jgi:hypothetical protein